jgi:hypothetical protein
LKTYADAFAALVPAEVLTLHAVIISATTATRPVPAGAGNETATAILPGAVTTLEASFWGLLVLSVAFYVATRLLGGKWDKLDWIRVAIAPVAFVGWTMIQRVTAFDAAFPTMNPIARTVTALFIGAILGAVTTALATKADQKPPP